jgi:hypothetical protein
MSSIRLYDRTVVTAKDTDLVHVHEDIGKNPIPSC